MTGLKYHLELTDNVDSFPIFGGNLFCQHSHPRKPVSSPFRHKPLILRPINIVPDQPLRLNALFFLPWHRFLVLSYCYITMRSSVIAPHATINSRL